MIDTLNNVLDTMIDFLSNVLATIIVIAVSVGISGALWVGANLFFNQARKDWHRFSTIAGGIAGFVLLGILHGNRAVENFGITSNDVGDIGSWIWMPIIGAGLGATVGRLLAGADDPARRMQIGVSAGVGAGLLVGLLLDSSVHPEINWIAFPVVTLLGAGFGSWWGTRSDNAAGHRMLTGAAIGALIGGFGFATTGEGTVAEALIATLVPSLLAGARLGRTTNPTREQRTRIDSASRPIIFIAPALIFIASALVVPTIGTTVKSLRDTNDNNWVGFQNYWKVWSDRNSIDVSNWTDIFSSQLFYIGGVVLLLALAVGFASRRHTGRAFELGGPGITPLLIALTLLVFASMSVLRGTIMNNLWWVFTVTIVSTGLGLAIAVIADGTRLEAVAKSIIFMPMAISLVGASIIWRFMFLARNPGETQTGVMNAVWVSIGKASRGEGWPTTIAIIVLGIITIVFALRFARNLVSGNWMSVVLPGLGTFFFGWLWFQFAGWIGNGFGGAFTNSAGEVVEQPLFFVQDQPYNSVWLMLILIWIQTGFAMVILSAAIKAVPTELIEAARVDGATEGQVFWRITLPQIATTIGVVVTTLIVLVMKVYDIVKVVTNGNFGTQVLANDFFQKAFFSTGSKGVGAALAVILFLSVLPVMIYNIRRMQAEAA